MQLKIRPNHLIKQIIVFIFLFGNLCVSAEIADSSVKTVKIDSAFITVRTFSAESLEKFHQDEDFFYDRIDAPTASLWQKFKNWLFYHIFSFIAEYTTPLFWKILAYVFIAIVAIYIILKLLKVDFKGLFYNSKKVQNLSISNITLKNEDIDYRKLIDAFIAQKKFRNAVRMMFLQSLNNLVKADKISFEIDKTNREYLNEISDPDLKIGFQKICNSFEFIWYGKFNPGQRMFSSIKETFENFNSGIAH